MAGQRSVLVVDSDLSELATTVSLLESAGYHVAATADFDQAKQLLASHTPDLLITSVRLGSFNGLHLVLRSRSEHPAMAAIVTSRYRDAVLENEAQRQGADFLVRPIPNDAFLALVTRSLGASSTPPDRAAGSTNLSSAAL